MLQDLKGIIPPMATPLTGVEEVDLRGVERLLRHLLSGGVNGVFLLGSTGEFPALEIHEKIKLIEAVTDLTMGRVPVLVGVTEPGTKRTEKLIREIKNKRVAALVVALPYYYPLDRQAVLTHYRYIAQNVELPVILYNIPRTTGTHIEVETVVKLVTERCIYGVKDSSGDFSHFQDLLFALCMDSENHIVPIFQGEEKHAAASLLMGADGLIPAYANVAPRLYSALWQATREGNVDRAIKLQTWINKATKTYSFGSAYGSIKVALQILGISDSHVSLPLQKPSPDQIAQIEGLLKQLEENGLL